MHSHLKTNIVLTFTNWIFKAKNNSHLFGGTYVVECGCMSVDDSWSVFVEYGCMTVDVDSSSVIGSLGLRVSVDFCSYNWK